MTQQQRLVTIQLNNLHCLKQSGLWNTILQKKADELHLWLKLHT